MLAFRDDLNGHQAAKPYAEGYRSPAALEVAMGKLETTDAGDYDADGFNEAEGCYVLGSGADGVAFTLPGRQTPCMNPAFKVLRWKAEAPRHIRLGERTLAPAMDFNASVRGEILLLQILSRIHDSPMVTVLRKS